MYKLWLGINQSTTLFLSYSQWKAALFAVAVSSSAHAPFIAWDMEGQSFNHNGNMTLATHV